MLLQFLLKMKEKEKKEKHAGIHDQFVGIHFSNSRLQSKLYLVGEGAGEMEE